MALLLTSNYFWCKRATPVFFPEKDSQNISVLYVNPTSRELSEERNGWHHSIHSLAHLTLKRAPLARRSLRAPLARRRALLARRRGPSARRRALLARQWALLARQWALLARRRALLARRRAPLVSPLRGDTAHTSIAPTLGCVSDAPTMHHLIVIYPQPLSVNTFLALRKEKVKLRNGLCLSSVSNLFGVRLRSRSMTMA
jgi:hypothetical protein